MCGIAGLLNKLPPEDAATFKQMAWSLNAMQKKLLHRGPEDKGAYFSPCQQAALTHTRLSIIDLTNNGNQPMSINDGRYTITFDGVIYNYKKLRAQLEENGETFKTFTDTEVILKLYINKGSKCVHSLRGMFAFMIWDNQEKTGFAARDAFGIKPFYYRNKSGNFAFASELRSLLASGLSSQHISAKGVKSYLLQGAVSEPDTLIRDVKMLPSGSYLTWKNGSIKVKRYWKLKFETHSYSPAKSIEITRTALEHCVRAHLVSDVPVAVFLSGGINSTALVALATQLSRKKINTYSITFEDPEWNQGEISKRVAEHFGTNHTEFLMTAELALPLFKAYLSVIDQPTIDGFNSFCLSRLASENDEKVVLSGLGGDELFAGHKSFDVIPDMMNKLNTASKLNFIISPIITKLNKHLRPQYRRISDALLKPNSVAAVHQSLRSVFSQTESQELTNTICGKNAASSALNEPTHATLADNISHLELTTKLCNQLLRDSDIASMAWGLELRVPFVDRVLFEQTSSIPANIRLKQGKQLLIDSVPEIPEWVVDQAKPDSNLLYSQWFSKELQSFKMPETPNWIPLSPWNRQLSLAILNQWKNQYVKAG